MKEYSQIKFLKAAVPDILAGQKTLEARPRSMGWINEIADADVAELTWGARFAPPTVFARARIERVAVKPFAEATAQDVARSGSRWQNESVATFVAKHEEWYAKLLQKGYPVVWIYFTLV